MKIRPATGGRGSFGRFLLGLALALAVDDYAVHRENSDAT